VLDEERKVVAWIEEELHRVRPARADQWSEPARRVVLRGVRGYGGEFQRLERLLARAPGLRPGRGDFEPRQLLPPPPRRPGRWPNLPRGIRAREALARIGASQLEALEANEGGIRAGADAEHVHDARVALRRLRSLLGQLPGILDEAEREHLSGELRWLAGCMGPARDLDTLLFELRLSEPELRAELAPLVSRLEAARALQQVALVRALDSARCARLRARLEACFAKDGSHAGPRASRPFARVVAKRLRRRLAQLVAGAERLGAASPPAELHALRITCKKLRYLMECCRGLVPAAALSRCSADLKGLQEVLGAIQDAEVQAALVGAQAHALAADVAAPVLLALGRFQERILQRGAAARRRYAEVAAAFLAPAGQASFAALVRALGGGQEPR
jgi:CHAD domain-containing protein